MNLSGVLHSLLIHCCPDTYQTTGKAKLLWLSLSFFLLLLKEGEVIMWSEKLLQAVCNMLKPDPIYRGLDVSLTKA